MKRNNGNSEPEIRGRRFDRCFLREGKPVIELTGELPEAPGAALLNAYYRRLYRRLAGYCARELISELPEREHPLRLCLEYHVRLITPALLSLTVELFRRDRHVMPAARFAAVWSRSSGTPLGLGSFFPRPSAAGRRLREWLTSEAVERLRSGRCLYDPRAAERAGRLFDPQNFFAAEKGLVLFFPPLTLGSAAEGIPEFLLPWDQAGPRMPEN